MPGMNIMVPLGGLGSRFQKEGYNRPKPFVRVMGQEMILWLLERLSLGEEDTLVIVFNPAFMDMDRYMEEVVASRFSNVVLVHLTGPTRGAAETVRLGLQGLPMDQRARPTMLCDGDCFYTVDIVSMYRTVSATHNATFTFEDTQPKPLFSYVTVEANNEVVDIKEKVKISDYANCGCYCFKNGVELEKYCGTIIDAGLMQLSQDMKGEFYTSGVIKAMLDDKIPCKMLLIGRRDMHVLGTPAQLVEWTAQWPEQPRRTIGFDLDTALLLPSGAPVKRNIEHARRLRKQGHRIVVTTSQRMGMSELRAKLDAMEVPFDELRIDPVGIDLYVSAASVDALAGDLDQQMGLYPTSHHATFTKVDSYSDGPVTPWSFQAGVAVGALLASALFLGKKFA